MDKPPGIAPPASLKGTGGPKILKSAGATYQARSSTPEFQKVLFVSFYTANTPYEIEILSLVESMRQFDFSYHIAGFESWGSWRENCFLKAYYLRQVLEQFPEYKAIVWLDADSIMSRVPKLFFEFTNVDFAIRGRGPDRSAKSLIHHGLAIRSMRDLRYFYQILRGRALFDDFHNAVMYLRNNEKMRKIIDDWIVVIEEKWGRWKSDQRAFKSMFRKHGFYGGTLKMYNLPVEYAVKTSLDQGGAPSPDSVILQKQVSKLYRGASPV